MLDQVRGAGLPVELTVLGTAAPLAPGIDLTAYRIVQEALTNTVRHAHGAEAAVTLCYEPGYLTVSIADSGRSAANGGAANGAGPGMSGSAVTGPEAAGLELPRSGGFGLAGIAERVASCGGNLAVGPSPGGGFAITARLPAR